MRKARTTPTGSFSRSKREICVMIGRSRIDAESLQHAVDELGRRARGSCPTADRLTDRTRYCGIGQPLRERRRRKDRAVVALDERFEKIPDRRDCGETDRCGSARSSAGPGRGRAADERRRLRVVNHRERRVEVDPLPVALVVGEEDVEGLGRQPVRPAVQRVVEGLGDLEEVGAALHDLPPDVHAQLTRAAARGDSGFRPRRRRPPSS